MMESKGKKLDEEKERRKREKREERREGAYLVDVVRGYSVV